MQGEWPGIGHAFRFGPRDSKTIDRGEIYRAYELDKSRHWYIVRISLKGRPYNQFDHKFIYVIYKLKIRNPKPFVKYVTISRMCWKTRKTSNTTWKVLLGGSAPPLRTWMTSLGLGIACIMLSQTVTFPYVKPRLENIHYLG